MNAPKLHLLSMTIEHDRPKFSSSQSQPITEHNTTRARLIVCLKKLAFGFSLIRFFWRILWLNDTYYSKSI